MLYIDIIMYLKYNFDEIIKYQAMIRMSRYIICILERKCLVKTSYYVFRSYLGAIIN
ncbi:hypothetical protein CNEO4_700029 [Clostridium neonatale]|nr:hypothetical protein CNEO3_20131 [Clostridium neonatale]CAI3623128.1 hypothetical protein CNEO3_280038 [Clostridium neonatale]CAI3652356.1 hypothetical protein CNEO2_320041 [Clostridium neonatale]CAI3685356.1 hypothetical protein CNEO4_700029 [Clostridium neonatale]CAI3718477.1 hypothetical protein CNEO4_940130 [Clostridium neonatale]